MSFVPCRDVGSEPSAGDDGKEARPRHPWQKEIGRKSSWKIVSLRVPGTVDYQRSSSIPDVIRICQDPLGQKKLRKKFKLLRFIIVPEWPEFGAPEQRQGCETSASSCVPSIKRCSLDEIESVKRHVERVARKLNSRNRTDKQWGRTQHTVEIYKTPRTSMRMGVTT